MRNGKVAEKRSITFPTRKKGRRGKEKRKGSKDQEVINNQGGSRRKERGREEGKKAKIKTYEDWMTGV